MTTIRRILRKFVSTTAGPELAKSSGPLLREWCGPVDVREIFSSEEREAQMKFIRIGKVTLNLEHVVCTYDGPHGLEVSTVERGDPLYFTVEEADALRQYFASEAVGAVDVMRNCRAQAEADLAAIREGRAA
jgi:hypothetical protein